MQRIHSFIGLVLFFLISQVLFSQDPTDFRFLTLKNGLRVVLQQKKTVPLTHFVLAVGIGARDEDPAGNGSVHLLEHILLFGSNRRQLPQEKVDSLRKLGAYYNGHTTFDYMNFEISAGAEHALKIPALIKENVFEPAFREEEIAGEKPIIQEEIRKAENDPRQLSTQLLLQELFRGHPYGRPLLGQVESIAAIGATQLQELHDRFFVPENCVLAVVGRFDTDAVAKEIESQLGSLPARAKPAAQATPIAPLEKKKTIERVMDVERGHLVIAAPAPSFNHEDRVAFSILVQLLARGRNPQIYRAFLPDPSVVDQVDVQYLSMKEGGMLLVRLSADAKSLSLLEGKLIGFLRKVGQMDFSRDDVLGEQSFYMTDLLQGGKNLLQLASENSREEGLQLANAYAAVLFLRDGTDVADFFAKIKKTKSTDLRRTADRFLSKTNWLSLAIRPLAEGKEK